MGRPGMKSPEGLTIFLESINASPEVVAAINESVLEANIDIANLTYKDIKKLVVSKEGPLHGVIEAVSNEFGIPATKIAENKDLDSTQRKSAQEFIKKNSKELLDMLPEGETRSGQATGVANTKLGKLYTKGARLTVAEGATAAGKFAQTKRDDVTIEEFNSIFGINPDGTIDNNRKHDGAIRQLVAQASMITANQTLRQQAIQRESNPMSQIALLGDGKGAMMFSRKGNTQDTSLPDADIFYDGIGRFDRGLSNANRYRFWARTSELAKHILAPRINSEPGVKKPGKKDLFERSRIETIIKDVYGDVFTVDELNTLTDAVTEVAMSNRVKISQVTAQTFEGEIIRFAEQQQESVF